MDYNNILVKYEDSSSLGLESGRCGLVLLNFLLSDKDEKYKDKALIHLHYLLEHVYDSTTLSFNEGLMGIGWTLEFLAQNQYISNSCDSLLYEIDDIIYKWMNFHQLYSFSLNNGFIGALLYFCYRLKGNRILTPNRELALKECTIRILGKLYAESKKQTDAQFSEMEWRQLHVLAGLFNKMKIHKYIADDLLEETKKMVKKVPQKRTLKNKFNMMEVLYFLFAESANNRMVTNFFLS